MTYRKIKVSIPADVQTRMDAVGMTREQAVDGYLSLDGYPAIQRQYAKVFGIKVTRAA